MSILAQVTKGIVRLPYLILIYGPDGIGKTTLAANGPSPIFIGTEKGTGNIDTSRLPSPKNYGEFIDQLDALKKEKHPYKTLALDSIDWINTLLERKICEDSQADQIADAKGGYGKGTAAVNLLWKEHVFSRLNELREAVGMHIVLIAHSQVKKCKDPMQPSDYDMHQLSLPDTTAALFRQYVDAVLFANYEVFVKKTDGKMRAFGDGARVMFTEGRPGFHAKNRLNLPFRMALSWDELDRAIQSKAGEKPEVIIESIKDMMGDITNPKIKANVETWLKEFEGNSAKLITLKNKVIDALAAQQGG